MDSRSIVRRYIEKLTGLPLILQTMTILRNALLLLLLFKRFAEVWNVYAVPLYDRTPVLQKELKCSRLTIIYQMLLDKYRLNTLDHYFCDTYAVM